MWTCLNLSNSHTRSLLTFAFRHVPLIFWLRPKIISLSEDETHLVIPLRRRSKNHLGAMYFGALCVGADCAAGFFAYHLIRSSGENVRLVFKDMSASFFRRAHSDVHFICRDGEKIKSLVESAVSSTKRVESPIRVEAFTEQTGRPLELVAEFTLTLSLKR